MGSRTWAPATGTPVRVATGRRSATPVPPQWALRALTGANHVRALGILPGRCEGWKPQELPLASHGAPRRSKCIHMPCLRPLCDIPSGCCSFTGPWTVTRSSLRMLRRVAAFYRPLRPVLLLVSFPRSRSPVVGVLGLC